MKKYLLFFILFCISATLKAQTDTVAAKIRKLPFIHVDVAARFPAGDFSKYIAANFNYKKKSDRNLNGEVIISMKIDSTGQVSNVNVLKNMFPDIDREVVRVIRSSPKWQPAVQKGKPIAVYLVFNIDMGIIGSLAPVKPTTPPVKSTPAIAAPVVTNNKAVPDTKKPNGLIGPPTPAPEKKTVLKAIKKQVPPFDKKPVPVEKKPLLQVAKKVTQPVVIKKPSPVVAKPIVKKPVPQVAKKTVIPTPVVKPVEKRPVPPVAKKVIVPLPAVKLIEKKPVPQVAKVIVKPVEKKPVVLTSVKPKPVIAKKPKKAADDDNVKLKPSTEALFPDGGQPGFFRYLSENISYPVLSKVNKIEGEVRVTFFVEKDGTISDIKTLSAPAEDLAQEAKRVIMASPRWKPAMQNGIAVREPFTVPINFRIQDTKSGQ